MSKFVVAIFFDEAAGNNGARKLNIESTREGLWVGGKPHQVAVPATDCRGSHGRFMDAFCLDLAVCERHHSVFRVDKWWVVYCFADAEHAEKLLRLGPSYGK